MFYGDWMEHFDFICSKYNTDDVLSIYLCYKILHEYVCYQMFKCSASLIFQVYIIVLFSIKKLVTSAAIISPI